MIFSMYHTVKWYALYLQWCSSVVGNWIAVCMLCKVDIYSWFPWLHLATGPYSAWPKHNDIVNKGELCMRTHRIFHFDSLTQKKKSQNLHVPLNRKNLRWMYQHFEEIDTLQFLRVRCQEFARCAIRCSTQKNRCSSMKAMNLKWKNQKFRSLVSIVVRYFISQIVLTMAVRWLT